jgi:chromatin structure-remodeling complex subunit RSC1/2
VCDSRYNDRERIFVKIKNWNSCVPEEVRKSADFMPIYPFETNVFPRRFPSPFLSGGRGTGRIGESVERGDGDKFEGGGTGRKRVRRTGNAGATSQTDYSGPSKGVYVGPPVATAAATTFSVAMSTQVATTNIQPYHLPPATFQQQRSVSAQPRFNEDRSILTAAGGLTTLGAQNVLIERLPPETGELCYNFLGANVGLKIACISETL